MRRKGQLPNVVERANTKDRAQATSSHGFGFMALRKKDCANASLDGVIRRGPMNSCGLKHCLGCLGRVYFLAPAGLSLHHTA